jgi:hypothetical protein
MTDTARDDYKTIEPATTEGLEDFFDVEVKDLDQIQARSRTGVDVIQDRVQARSRGGVDVIQDQIQGASKMIPLSKAAEISGKARRYLLTLIHKGKLEGEKDQSGAWLVSLDQIQARSRTGVDVIQDQVLEVVQDQIQPPGFDALSLFRELQAATFRNGYLESQVATYSEQVKLLPDLQAKAKEADDYKTMMEAKDAQLMELQAQIDDLKRGWWSKFSTWFFKGQ